MNKPQIVEVVRDIAVVHNTCDECNYCDLHKPELEELGEVLQVTRCQLAASAILFLCVSELKKKLIKTQKGDETGKLGTYAPIIYRNFRKPLRCTISITETDRK